MAAAANGCGEARGAGRGPPAAALEALAGCNTSRRASFWAGTGRSTTFPLIGSRAPAHQAPAAISAYQLGRALDCSTSGKSPSWRSSLHLRRFPRPTPARCPYPHPCHNIPSHPAEPHDGTWWATQGDGAVRGRASPLPHHPPGGEQPRRPKERCVAATQTHPPTPSPPVRMY